MISFAHRKDSSTQLSSPNWQLLSLSDYKSIFVTLRSTRWIYGRRPTQSNWNNLSQCAAFGTYLFSLKQFSPNAALVKSTFLSFDSENKILILNISWKRKITFLNFTWYTHFTFASNFTFESNFAISNARHMPFARLTTSARHTLNRKIDLRSKRYEWNK